MSVLILNDPVLASHDVIARLYAESIAAVGQPVTVESFGNGGTKPGDARVALHVTVGPRFDRLPGMRNVAVVHHEWSRYPARWVERLEAFDEVWVTSDHTADVLQASGLGAVAAFVPPALDIEPRAPKTTWEAHRPFRFVACGEAHFRKGFHLLLDGFCRAFPEVGEATLTIKTTAGCAWESPRPDVMFITAHLSPEALNELYRKSDVLVSASLGEGLGLPLAEAMLVGLPVAANCWGGHRSLVTRGGVFEIPYRLVDQVFSSTPAYYAPGQQCAFSDPEAIAGVLRTAATSSSHTRKAMALRAKEALVARYGVVAALPRIHERVQSRTGS